MSRALLSLWRFGQPSAALFVGVLIACVALGVPEYSWPIVVWGTVMLLFWAVANRWVFRLAIAVRTFKTRSGSRIILHFDPALGGADLAALEKLFESALDVQRDLLGLRLWRRPVVYLFLSHKTIRHLVGPFGGFAFWSAKAILNASDTSLSELVPHEVCHLIAAGLNRKASPLVEEGLAMWLQVSREDDRLHAAARPFITSANTLLPMLLNRKTFQNEDNYWCYAFAGSFTAFLVKQFGWQSYRTFYGKA